MDRTYFKSVYLRDPDGHILELATVGPGLTVDEPLEELGRRPVGAGGRALGLSRRRCHPGGGRPSTRRSPQAADNARSRAPMAALAGTWVSRGAEVAGVTACSPAGVALAASTAANAWR